MNYSASPPESPDASHPGRLHPRARYRGAFRISLGVSAVIHILAIALYPSFFSGIPSAGLRFGGPAQPFSPAGTELLNLVELSPDQDPDTPPPPDEVVDPDVTVVPIESGAPGIDAPPGLLPPDQGPRGPTAAERIRPKAGDLRYWAPIDPERTALSEEEILRLRFIAQVEAMNDSAAIAAQRAAEAMDWTYTDDEGKKWGVSPGQIHLGDLTIPMPFGFGAAPGQRERAEDRLWAWDEIERGAASGALNNSWKARDAAIRARMEAQRKPDTTRSGGGRLPTPN